MQISVFGSGYVGLVTGVCFSDFGHNIFFVDVDQKKLDLIKKGISPIYEPGLDKLMKKNKKNLQTTTDYKFAIKNSEITFICVGTPSKKDGSIDLSYIKKVSENIGNCLKQKEWHLVVVKSTVVPETTKDFVIPILEKNSGKKAGIDFGVAMNPEFLREGKAVQDFLNPDRIVVGTYDEKSKIILQRLYKDFDCTKIFTGLSEAEMIKYASNAFLATKISFINEIGNICKKLGINTHIVAKGMGHDKRIGRAFLDSGVGWGGSCFPKDVEALILKAKSVGEKPRILEQTVKVNDLQPLKLVELLKKHIPNLKGKEIGILGLAFKKDTDDVRESRAIPVIRELIKEKAVVKAYDPKAMDNFKKIFPNIEYCNANDIMNSDAILILTDWDAFKKLNYKGKIVIDGRYMEEAKKGIYEGICW
jgi:UDPglucose 6-dehydrogenase